MRPARFEYFDPRTTGEALELLDRYGEEAKVLAGGLSLVSMMKLRLLAPRYVIDVGRIPGGAYIKDDGRGGLQIGALTGYRLIETSDLVQTACPVLAETVTGIGDPQVRNRGTLGGNVCHADPAGDGPPVMLALAAEMQLVRSTGERRVAAEDFFLDVYTTALHVNELLVEIHIPARPPNTGQHFLKLTQKSGSIPLVSVAAVVTLDAHGACVAARVVLGAVGPVPARARQTEALLLGKPASAATLEAAAARAADDLAPPSDIHASADYRREMAVVMTRRALTEACARARGGR